MFSYLPRRVDPLEESDVVTGVQFLPGSLAGTVRALEEARRCAERGQPIALIPGSSFRLENGSRLVLLPEDHAGYTELCTLITRGRREGDELGVRDLLGHRLGVRRRRTGGVAADGSARPLAMIPAGSAAMPTPSTVMKPPKTLPRGVTGVTSP